MLCHKEVVYVDYALQRADYLAFGEQQQDSQHLDTAISMCMTQTHNHQLLICTYVKVTGYYTNQIYTM